MCRAVSPGLQTLGSPTEASPVTQWTVRLCQVLLEVLVTQDLEGQAGPCPLGAHTQVGRKREMIPRNHVLTVISDGGEWYPGEKTEGHARKGLSGGGFCRQGGQKGLLRR